VVKIISLIFLNLVTPKVWAKHEALLNKLNKQIHLFHLFLGYLLTSLVSKTSQILFHFWNSNTFIFISFPWRQQNFVPENTSDVIRILWSPLRPVCWTSRSNLNGGAKWDQIHNNHCYEFVHITILWQFLWHYHNGALSPTRWHYQSRV